MTLSQWTGTSLTMKVSQVFALSRFDTTASLTSEVPAPAPVAGSEEDIRALLAMPRGRPAEASSSTAAASAEPEDKGQYNELVLERLVPSPNKEDASADEFFGLTPRPGRGEKKRCRRRLFRETEELLANSRSVRVPPRGVPRPTRPMRVRRPSEEPQAQAPAPEGRRCAVCSLEYDPHYRFRCLHCGLKGHVQCFRRDRLSGRCQLCHPA